MQQKQLISQHFAKRVNLSQIEMQKLIDEVINDYQLGILKNASGIEVGYEDVNFILETTSGKYLLKILIDFTVKKPRSYENSLQYVDTMEQLRSFGIPIPKLYKAGNNYLLKKIVPHNDEPIWMLVMEFFEGNDFINQRPTLENIKDVAKILTKIATAKMVRQPMYDPWEPQYFIQEYNENAKLLLAEDKKLVDEVYQEYQELDIEKLQKSIIHADFMKNNLLINEKNEYCVLDFGVVNFGPRIADLAVFLAGYCLDPEFLSLEENQTAYKTGLDEYTKYIELTDYEKKFLGTMVKASFALFHIAATHEKKVEDNQTEENEYWINLGRLGLQLTQKMSL